MLHNEPSTRHRDHAEEQRQPLKSPYNIILQVVLMLISMVITFYILFYLAIPYLIKWVTTHPG